MTIRQETHELDFLRNFPYDIYAQPLPLQQETLTLITTEFDKGTRSFILESPTGSGKTAIAYTFLRTLLRSGRARLFYITPTKHLVRQVRDFFPDVRIALGRNEHYCLFYRERYRADEVPCTLLTDCPHRVDQQTGITNAIGVIPCPYLQQKYESKQGGIVICTISFYLFSQLYHNEFGAPEGLVIDEIHRLAKLVRNSLSYEITDHHLRLCVNLLRNINSFETAERLEEFLETMVQIIRRRRPRESTLLEPHEINELLRILDRVDERQLNKSVRDALRSGLIDADEHRLVLRRIETLIYDIRRYIRAFGYALPTEERNPLGYVFSYYTTEREENRRVQHTLFIKRYYVRPLIQSILSPATLAMSATIGNSNIVGWETGMEAPFLTFPSPFPVGNTRIFMPTDTPNLAHAKRSNRQPARVLRLIARTCRRFAERDVRSLVIVISTRELERFLRMAREENVDAISYGNGITSQQAVERFKEGECSVLAGTAANYGEGLDLPRNIAQVIFFLRPGYANPNEPATIFEERRYGPSRHRALQNWRVMIEALQVRGRNIRSQEDVGVTFFISQQFRNFLFGSLPEWLKPAYAGNRSFEQCVREAERLLAK